MSLTKKKSWTLWKSNQNIVMHEEMVQNNVIDEELVQNVAMVEKILKDCVVDVQIDLQVEMDL